MYEIFELDNGFKIEFENFNIFLRNNANVISVGISQTYKDKATQIRYIDIETNHFQSNFRYFKFGDFLSFKYKKFNKTLQETINKYDEKIKKLLLSTLYKKTRE